MTQQTVLEWRGRTMVDSNGDKVGTIEEIYLDVETDRPEWALVNTGLFGTKSTFVPLQGASERGEEVTVPYAKDQIKNAPSIDADQELTKQEENELYSHYGLGFDEPRSEVPVGGPGTAGTGPDVPGGTGVAGTADTDVHAREPGGPGHDTSGPNTDDAMTRSEEELDITKRQHETGRARLRKYVVTEHVTKTVPVQHEEVRVEREPITDANLDDATSGPPISEEEHEVTLHEEVVEVTKRTVPKERVRLEKDVVTEQETVSDDVRKEEIEFEGDGQERPY